MRARRGTRGNLGYFGHSCQEPQHVVGTGYAFLLYVVSLCSAISVDDCKNAKNCIPFVAWESEVHCPQPDGILCSVSTSAVCSRRWTRALRSRTWRALRCSGGCVPAASTGARRGCNSSPGTGRAASQHAKAGRCGGPPGAICGGWRTRRSGIGTMRITICPPGEALGARDLQRWSQRRASGWSGAGRAGDEWVDRFTRRPRTISCRGCGHSAVVEVSDAKVARSSFRCSRCGRLGR